MEQDLRGEVDPEREAAAAWVAGAEWAAADEAGWEASAQGRRDRAFAPTAAKPSRTSGAFPAPR